jgi:pyruvyl transferase EpsO
METRAGRAPSTPHGRLIANLRERIDQTLRPLLDGARSAALLDFPNHPNVGDSAIWLGELAYLRSLGPLPLRYTCDVDSYSRATLAARVRGGIILLSGGGNLGDLWEPSQRLRERVITDFPDTPIVQLPQSIHFRSRSALQRAKRVFDAHPALTLLVRDGTSLALARNEFRNPSHLCPDMAFWLGPLARPCAQTKDIIWLSRTDAESGGPMEAGMAAGVERIDWLAEPMTGLRRLKRWLDRQLLLHPRLSSGSMAVHSGVCAQVARQRLSRGCYLLASSRAVLTDRLHGHILSVLLGIPQFLLDNSTGKVRNFYETWTSGLPLVRWCNTPGEALALARAATACTGA